MGATTSTTIDAAGRLVVPKAIREAAGLRPDVPLAIRYVDGHVEIEPAPLEVTIEMRHGVAVATPLGAVGTVTVEQVEAVRRQLRDERQGRVP